MVKYKSKKSLFISFDSHFASWYKINVILILIKRKALYDISYSFVENFVKNSFDIILYHRW